MMNIAGLKEQARALERRGDTAAALDVYESIVSHLEGSSVEPEAPLYVKMGDLLLKTGRTSAAIAMFERAGERYALAGSHRSVIALCVKILRTDSSRSESYFKFAKRMLEDGHVEPTRLVLLDYAERAKMRKTLSKLHELESAPEPQLRAMLQKLLEVADRSGASSASPPDPERIAPAVAASAPAPAPESRVRPVRDTTVFEAITLPGPPPSFQPPPITPSPQPALYASEPLPVANRRSVAPSASAADAPPRRVEQQPAAPEPAHRAPVAREPVVRDTPKTAATVTSAVQEEPAVPWRRRFGAGVRNRSARPAWAIPALAAAAVVVFGVGLLTLGAFSSGGELGAEPPRLATESAEAPSASGPVPLATASQQPAAFPTSPRYGEDTSVAGVATRGGFHAIDEPDVRPVSLDQNALASVSEAAAAVDAGVVDAPLTDLVADAGRIAPDPGALTLRERPRPARTPPPVRGPDIVIEGLEVEGVARSSASYQVVQRLPSGTRITLTVQPFANAPAGENGILRVRAVGGDSAQGSVRFGNFFVTAQGQLTPDELGGLLDRLVERGE